MTIATRWVSCYVSSTWNLMKSEEASRVYFSGTDWNFIGIVPSWWILIFECGLEPVDWTQKLNPNSDKPGDKYLLGFWPTHLQWTLLSSMHTTYRSYRLISAEKLTEETGRNITRLAPSTLVSSASTLQINNKYLTWFSTTNLKKMTRFHIAWIF